MLLFLDASCRIVLVFMTLAIATKRVKRVMNKNGIGCSTNVNYLLRKGPNLSLRANDYLILQQTRYWSSSLIHISISINIVIITRLI